MGLDLLEADVDGAGAVLHSAPSKDHARGVVLFFGGLGCTKEKLAYGRRRRVFESAGFAVVLADHYNEGARRSADEAESNRGGWSRCQKDLFWRAIHRTAQCVPKLIDFCIATFCEARGILAYGSSMGGDILLASLLIERRLSAVCLERASPDWTRPDSTGNNLGECPEGDALYERHCPCNRTSDLVHHPTAILFLCGEADMHVPTPSVLSFVERIRQRSSQPGGPSDGAPCHEGDRTLVSVVPSHGWLGHVLKDAAGATSQALAFFDRFAGGGIHTAASPPPRSNTPARFTTSAGLEAFLGASGATLVCVFATAEWCVPCKRLLPGWRTVSEPEGDLFETFDGVIRFAVADLTDEAEEHVGGASTSISEKLTITKLPTFVLLRDGREVARAEGAAHKRPAKRLVAMLKTAAAAPSAPNISDAVGTCQTPPTS